MEIRVKSNNASPSFSSKHDKERKSTIQSKMAGNFLCEAFGRKSINDESKTAQTTPGHLKDGWSPRAVQQELAPACYFPAPHAPPLCHLNKSLFEIYEIVTFFFLPKRPDLLVAWLQSRDVLWRNPGMRKSH